MNHELAKTLTTALVQFIDRERPEGTMCCSNEEWESLEYHIRNNHFDDVEAFIQNKLSRLTEFEKCMLDFAKARDEYEFDSTKVVELNNKVIELTKLYSNTLLNLAKKELCSFCDEHLKGFSEGYDKANKDKSYHFPPNHIWSPLCWEPGGTCTNPHFDCINCPRKTTGGTFTSPNTASGTSTATLHGNTSVTDGKEHNPSFTD